MLELGGSCFERIPISGEWRKNIYVYKSLTWKVDDFERIPNEWRKNTDLMITEKLWLYIFLFYRSSDMFFDEFDDYRKFFFCVKQLSFSGEYL